MMKMKKLNDLTDIYMNIDNYFHKNLKRSIYKIKKHRRIK